MRPARALTLDRALWLQNPEKMASMKFVIACVLILGLQCVVSKSSHNGTAADGGRQAFALSYGKTGNYQRRCVLESTCRTSVMIDIECWPMPGRYCGAGTPASENRAPIDNLDACCRSHDRCFTGHCICSELDCNTALRK